MRAVDRLVGGPRAIDRRRFLAVGECVVAEAPLTFTRSH